MRIWLVSTFKNEKGRSCIFVSLVIAIIFLSKQFFHLLTNLFSCYVKGSSSKYALSSLTCGQKCVWSHTTVSSVFSFITCNFWASISSPKKWRNTFLTRFLWGFNKHIYSKKITNMSVAFVNDISGYLKTCQFLCLPYQLCWQKINQSI